MHDHRTSITPFALGGLLLAALLIILSRPHPSESTALQAAFAAQVAPVTTDVPTGPAPQVQPPVAPGSTASAAVVDAAGAAGGVAAQIAAVASEAVKGLGISIPNLLGPRAIASGQTARLAVEIFALEPEVDGVKVVGQVRNISAGKITVPISAFILHDGAGAEYVATTGQAELEPGTSTPLELSVPVPLGEPLTLTVDLPPDNPAEIVLQLKPLP